MITRVSGLRKEFFEFSPRYHLPAGALLSTTVEMAQTQQQPFLFASTSVNGQEAVVTFLRDETSGVLTLLPAAPILFAHQCLPEAIDQQSPPQFLFGVCADGVAMYTFDPTSGAVAEIALGSPCIASTTGMPSRRPRVSTFT